MGKMRKPFQGVWNIVRFNYHFYLLAVVIIAGAIFLGHVMKGAPALLLLWLSALAGSAILISLLVSWFVYDLSGFYGFSWLNELKIPQGKMLNVHAGFDETSALLNEKFHPQEFRVFDFYDPQKHTEISIRRARKVYPPFPGTERVKTSGLPGEPKSCAVIFVLLAAHEIRNEQERIVFFSELNRLLREDGKIIVTEHLRDTWNFLAYTFGVFHFHSRSTWQQTFSGAHLTIKQERKVTPFITTFILEKDGTAN